LWRAGVLRGNAVDPGHLLEDFDLGGCFAAGIGQRCESLDQGGELDRDVVDLDRQLAQLLKQTLREANDNLGRKPFSAAAALWVRSCPSMARPAAVDAGDRPDPRPWAVWQAGC